MERGYYTPKIEDLFVGYECEQDASYEENWKPYKVDFEYGWLEMSDNFTSNLRTPYLNKSDIESFGFKYDEKLEEFISNKTYLGIGVGDDKKIHIFYDEYRRLTIYYQENRGEVHVVFDGKCLSINELRKIMSYLNIERNGK